MSGRRWNAGPSMDAVAGGGPEHASQRNFSAADHVMSAKCLSAFCFGSLWLCGMALAQSLTPSELEGHSIVAEFVENVTTGRGESFGITWHDQVYFSTKGRILHRMNVTDSRPNKSRFGEAISDATRDMGQGVKYQWSGSGITRQWYNGRGLPFQQTISIARAQDGFSPNYSSGRWSRAGERSVSC